MARSREDVILPMTDDYMQQIVRGEKNYEFRRYRIAASVRRIWFYLNAPSSHIAYICEIDPAKTRNEGDPKLAEDGLGNKEFNERHKDWDGYDYAYRVRSVYELKELITLKDMKARYGLKGAPRGLVYVPPLILKNVLWSEQRRLLPQDPEPLDRSPVPSAGPLQEAFLAKALLPNHEGGSKRPHNDDALEDQKRKRARKSD